jgi:D-glycero-D-manno-heptose 1,7-bisphosphate phosphatase
MRRAVFLDRDGVINRAYLRDGKPRPPASSAAVEILPNVPEALSLLKAGGYFLIVVTNQPDAARGTMTKESICGINERLKVELQLDAILTCFHDDSDECSCRKPKPGLLLSAAAEFGIELSSSYMIGDRWRDVEAGSRAGCKTFFIDRGYEERAPGPCDFRVGSLIEAARIIVEPLGS